MLPKSITLVFVTVSMSHIYFPRCVHLLSIQSVAETVLSFQLFLCMRRLLRLSHSTPLPAACRLTSVTFLLLPLETQISSPGMGRSVDQLTSGLHACALERRRCTLPRRKLTWTWSRSVAKDTLHVPSRSVAFAGGVNSWKRIQRNTMWPLSHVLTTGVCPSGQFGPECLWLCSVCLLPKKESLFHFNAVSETILETNKLIIKYIPFPTFSSARFFNSNIIFLYGLCKVAMIRIKHASLFCNAFS